jgi:hypothetical protein
MYCYNGNVTDKKHNCQPLFLTVLLFTASFKLAVKNLVQLTVITHRNTRKIFSACRDFNNIIFLRMAWSSIRVYILWLQLSSLVFNIT